MEDYITLRDLNKLCGYVENGSSQALRIYQDDATRSWLVECGDRQAHWGRSLREALDKALAEAEDA